MPAGPGSARIVGDHFKGTLKDDEEGELMGAGAEAHRHVIASDEGFARGIAEGSGGVVHGAGEHAGEGQRGVVDGLVRALHLRYSLPMTPSWVMKLGQVRRSPSGLYAPWKSIMRWLAAASSNTR